MYNKKYNIFITLVCAFFSSSGFALSATTVNTIQGTKPYLLKDGVKITDTDMLLGITLSDGTPYGKDYDSSKVITLPSEDDTFESVTAAVPTDGSEVAATTLMNIYFQDDDGDNFDSIRSSASGIISAVWKDVKGNVIQDLTAKPAICASPYTLTVSTTGDMTIYSKYGDPDSSDPYTQTSKEYKIEPKSKPTICYARPNLDMNYPGTAWDSEYGFEVWKSSTNFPTTGFNKAVFDLIVKGVDATTLTWTGSSNGNITATAVATDSGTVKVTLTGPYYVTDSTNKNPTAKMTATSAGNPFTISGGSELSYSFNINKWFVILSTPQNYAAANTACNTIGAASPSGWSAFYSLGSIEDYSNSPSTIYDGSSVSTNHYTREIGGGVLSEWGNTATSYYTGAGWPTNSNYAFTWAIKSGSSTTSRLTAEYAGGMTYFRDGVNSNKNWSACMSKF